MNSDQTLNPQPIHLPSKNTKIAVFTPIHLDHTEILGNTIEKIATQKSGIIKPGCHVFSTSQQKPSVQEIILQASKFESAKSFYEVDVSNFEHQVDHNRNLLNFPQHILENAVLAEQVGKFWLENYWSSEFRPLKLSELLEKSSVLAGRSQVVEKSGLKFYLDGAHTDQSLEKCLDWFTSQTKSGNQKAIIFNLTGKRDHKLMLDLLKKRLNLNSQDQIIFTTNLTYRKGYSKELNNKTTSDDKSKFQIIKYQQYWKSISEVECQVENSIEEAFETIHSDTENVLITGSLHLVSGALEILSKK